MELLVVISHPGQRVRSPGSIVADLRRVYDEAYESASQTHHLAFAHATVILLQWGLPGLGWNSWHKEDAGTLVTVGLPLLYTSLAEGAPEADNSMVQPDRLARFVLNARDGLSEDLGSCGGYFAAAYAQTDGQVTLITNYLAEVPLYRASNAGGDGLVE